MNKFNTMVKIFLDMGTIILTALVTIAFLLDLYGCFFSPSYGNNNCEIFSIALLLGVLMAIALFEAIQKIRHNVFRIHEFNMHKKSFTVALWLSIIWLTLGILRLSLSSDDPIYIRITVPALATISIVAYAVVKFKKYKSM